MITKNMTIENTKGKRVLLINPPVYDFSYTHTYNQPDGLLRVATLLRNRGYRTALIDFLENPGRAKHAYSPQPDTLNRFDGRIRYHFGFSFREFERRLQGLDFYPDEVYVTSIMTYWWEATHDVIAIVKRHFSKTTVIVGGVYPTLCPEHAEEHLGADIINVGEIYEASDLWPDLSLYQKRPSYAIVNVSRGCPFNCAYCAQRILNGEGMRFREPEDVVSEMEYRCKDEGIRNFWLFSDNFLVGDTFEKTLSLLASKRLPINISAPKGVEPRLLTRNLLKLMKDAGWNTINMAFETANREVREKYWNRKHNTNSDFERAISLCTEQGFKTGRGGIVAFILFGTPGENLKDVRETISYLHESGIFIRPMPFTPVPGTKIYQQQEDFIKRQGLGLEDLNEKLFPFAEMNGISLREYNKIYSEIDALNHKLHRNLRVNLKGAVDLLKLGKTFSFFNTGLESVCPAPA